MAPFPSLACALAGAQALKLVYRGGQLPRLQSDVAYRPYIKQSVSRDFPGLEFGPSFNPIIAKADGYRTHVVDHLDQDALRQKYTGHGVDLDRIEPVDFIDDGGPLHRLLPPGQGYHHIVASHVIEHIPDLVGFLVRCHEALVDGGRLFLIVPDHRRCFDHFRPVSTPGQVLQAHLEKRRIHSPAAMFDHYLYAVTRNGAISWADGEPGHLELMFDSGTALQLATDDVASYRDCHGWTFTPSSCRLVFAALASTGHIALRESEFHGTIGTDFLIVLKKESTGTAPDLLSLMREASTEVGD